MPVNRNKNTKNEISLDSSQACSFYREELSARAFLFVVVVHETTEDEMNEAVNDSYCLYRTEAGDTVFRTLGKRVGIDDALAVLEAMGLSDLKEWRKPQLFYV